MICGVGRVGTIPSVVQYDTDTIKFVSLKTGAQCYGQHIELKWSRARIGRTLTGELY